MISVGYEECTVAGAYLYSFLCHFHVLILKKQALAVSHFTITLQMMSNNRISFSSIDVVHVQLILHKVCYPPDKEFKHDVTCWMTAAIFLNFLRS
jgi:hypothetical protein